MGGQQSATDGVEQGGEVRIITFKRGDWEERLLALHPGVG
jgi:hypothetical protein